ncbi:MAG: replication-relaxation family protein [Chloroflexota bacterium]
MPLSTLKKNSLSQYNPFLRIFLALGEKCFEPKQSRCSRLARNQKYPKIEELDETEQTLFRGLFHYGPLTTKQISKWLYEGKDKHAAKRLKLLFDNGYLRRQEQVFPGVKGRKPLVHSLLRPGINILVEYGIIHKSDRKYVTYIKATSKYFPHHKETNDCLISALMAAQTAGLTPRNFSNDALIRSRTRAWKGQKIPDLFLNFQDAKYDYRFFVEMDRCFQDRGIVEEKVYGYWQYSQTLEYLQLYGDEANPQYTLPLLIVCHSERRLESLVEHLVNEGTPGIERVLLSTLTEVTTQNFFQDPIWRMVCSTLRSRSFMEYFSE